MKICKRVIAVLLCAIMLIGVLPMGVFARENNDSEDVSNDVSISNDTSMGRILNNTLETASDDENGFAISYIDIDGKTAKVDISNEEACKLVVAIYDPGTDKMLASGMTDIEEDAGSATVDIEITTMPKYFVARAFALDINMGALCAKYESRHYTKEFEEFYNTTPNDFDDDKVIVFEEDATAIEDKQIDFGVIADDVQKADVSQSMEISYDADTNTFVFKNATAEVKALEPGDKYYYQYGENYDEFVLFKVASISVNGSTVRITEDEVSLADVFEYLKIDAEGDYDKATVNEIGEGFTLLEEENLTTQGIGDIDENFTKSKSFSMAVNLKPEGVDQGSLSGSVTGSLTVTTENSARVYYDARWGKDYYEIKSENLVKGEGKLTFTGTFDIDKMAKIPKAVDVSIPVSAFDLEIKVELDLSASISASFTYKLSRKITITASSNNKLNTTTDKDEDLKPDGDISGSVEVKIGIKVTVGLSLYIPFHGASLMKKDKKAGIDFLDWPYKPVTGISFTGAFGLKLSGKTEDIDFKHPHLCISGNVKLYFNFSGSFMLCFVPHVLDWTWKIDFVNSEKPIWDFYLSFSPLKFEFGKVGTVSCPNKYIEVQVKVTDSLGNDIKDAVVTAPNCICDANGDGQYNETQINTDVNGLASIYLKKGNHTVSATYNGETKSRGVDVLNVSKTIIISFASTNPDNPDQPNVGSSDGTGSNDGWIDSTHFRFGSYPQSRVTDTSTISTLNSKASGWESYNYYTGTGSYADGQMTASNYMQYCDVKLDGNKYRGVTFSQYRPYYTGYTSSASYSYQDDHGFNVDTVYWFKYEPLEWRVLDASTGLVMCETIIDSQPYNNYIISNGTDSHGYTAYWGNSAQTYYASDYANSSIRKWLTEDFYATAFSSTQQSKIKTTTLNNDGYYTLTGTTGYEDYDSAATNDKIFLLSYDEVLNSSYGFSTSNSTYDSARQAKGSDYAKCQGLYVYNSSGSSYDGCSSWRLRSPGINSYFTCSVNYDGNVHSLYYTYSTNIGVRPALKLNLSSLGTQSTVGTQAVVGTGIFDYSCSACEAGGEYILLNVTGYGDNFTLSTGNLEYIDQITADASGRVSGKFVPRKAVSGSTTLLIGKFGNSVSAKKLTVTEETSGTPDPVIPDIKIKNYKSSLSVDYKSKLIFHTDIEAPDGYKIVWSNGNEGSTCTINQATDGEYKIKADLVRISDNKVVKSTQEETVKVNTGFFAKIIAFFKGLFGSLPVYEDNNKR